MRKVFVVVGIIAIVVAWGALSGSGLSLPGTATSATVPITPGAPPTSTPSQSAFLAPTPAQATPITSAVGSQVISSTSQIVTTTGPLVLLNPSRARPGSTVGVTGSGFNPGATIDLYLKHQANDAGKSLGFVQADKDGSFGGFTLTMPADYASGPFIVLATQHDGKKQAMATGTVAANSPLVAFGNTVGKVGDVATFSLKGFAPNEVVTIYFNSLSSPPIGTVLTDSAGSAGQQHIKVPYGAIGNNAIIFLGKVSQSPVTVTYTLLNLYPTLMVNTFAAKADSTLSFSGKGFGPNERVFIHVNSAASPPVGIALTDATGAFKDSGLFTIPFTLHGKTNIIAIGEESQAPVSISVNVLPYTPSAETSTYGGRPGTTISFYGTGFARDEVVHVYVGRSRQNAGSEVSCMLADSMGNFSAGGSYTLQPGPAGQLAFTLVGDRSKVPAVAKMSVMAPDNGAPAPRAVAQPPFHCSLATSTSLGLLPTPTPVPAAPPPTPVDVNNNNNGGGP